MRAVKMKNKKILFISLGCDKNLVDSEVMLGILADRGFEMTDTEDDAVLSSSTPAVLSMMLKKKASTRSWKWQNIKRPVRARL